MKIGIIIANSNVYPALPLDFVRGVKLGFLQAKSNVEYFVETAGNGGIAELIESAGNRLVIEKDVDTVIAFISTRVCRGLSLFMSKSKIPLFICNTGENIYANLELSPYVFYNSLNFCSGAYSLGNYIAENGYKTPLMAMSYYDCGYNIHFSFHQGFEATTGDIPHYYISRDLFNDKDKSNFKAALEQKNNDVIFAVFCGNESDSFLEFLSSNNTEEMPVFLSPYAIQTENETAETALKRIYFSYNSWSPKLINNNNVDFVEAFHSKHQVIPNPINAIGFETSTLISLLDGNSLKSGEIESNAIRNNFAFNETTRCFSSDHLLMKIEGDEQFILNQLPELPSYNLLKAKIDLHSTVGWDNPYLCV